MVSNYILVQGTPENFKYSFSKKYGQLASAGFLLNFKSLCYWPSSPQSQVYLAWPEFLPACKF